MAIIANKKERTYELAPVGNHVAYVYRVLHIGTAPELIKGNVENMNKLHISFELCNEKRTFKEGEPEQPMQISREFTLSMGKKSNLRPFIEGLFGIALQDEEAYTFDMKNLLGQSCLINVVHQTSKVGKEYAFIQSASPIPKGMTVPPMHNTAQKLDYENFDEKLFETLPNFLKDKICKTEEFKKMRNPDQGEYPIDSEEIPF